jgi:hypothetical protein
MSFWTCIRQLDGRVSSFVLFLPSRVCISDINSKEALIGHILKHFYGNFLQSTHFLFKLVTLFSNFIFLQLEIVFSEYLNVLGHAVAQLVKALCYKPEGRGIESR